MPAAPRRFLPRRSVVRDIVRGPDPVGSFVTALVDAMAGRGMNGHSGSIVIGEASTRRATGELGPKQFFRGAVPLARAAADRKGFNQALPSTHGPVVSADPVLDLLARTQIIRSQIPTG